MVQLTQLLTKLVIGGVDYSSYLVDYDFEDVLKNRSGNIIKLVLADSVRNVVSFTTGLDVTLSEGVVTNTERNVFVGKIFNIQLVEGQLQITAKDQLQLLGGDFFSATYDSNIDPEAGVISAIWSDIVTEGGFTPSAENSGTTLILERFRARDKTRLERMDTLAKVLGWTMRCDYNAGTIRLQPPGYTAFGTTLLVGSNVFNTPIWEENLEPMRNKIKVKGAFEEGIVVDSFTGDGTTTTKILIYNPKTTKLRNTTTSTDLRRGIANSPDVGDYQVDEDLKKITFTTAPTAAHVIAIEYSALLPKDVEGQNNASIAATGITRAEVFEFKDIATVNDAETRLRKLLDLIGSPFVSTTLYVDQTLAIYPGNTVSVVDPDRPEKSGNYVVTSVRRGLKLGYAIIKVGATDFDIRDLYETIDARLNALEDAELVDTSILRQILQTDGRFINVVARYSDVYQRNSTGSTTLYWAPHANPNSLWDTYNWGSADTGDPIADGYTLTSRVHGDNSYRETVVDTVFYDSGTSTGTTWNTTTNTITISAGTMRSKTLFVGKTYLYAMVEFGAATGTFTTEITADNGVTWQALTPGVRTLLTSSNAAGVRLRITSAASSTLTNLAIQTPTNGIYKFPAIELTLEE